MCLISSKTCHNCFYDRPLITSVFCKFKSYLIKCSVCFFFLPHERVQFPYYHRFQLGMNWSNYSITSRKRRFKLTIFRGKCRRESIQQSTQRWTPADARKRLVQKSPCSWQLFWVGFVFFFKRLLCHFKYCAAFVLVCNELHVNFLGLLSLQEEASSFFFLQASEGQYDWGGRFFLKHAPSPVAPVSQREPANFNYSVMFVFLV